LLQCISLLLAHLVRCQCPDLAAAFGVLRTLTDGRHGSTAPLLTRCGRTQCQDAALHLHRLAGYSITSSAIVSSTGGTVRPSILAVSALMTSSNLVDCTTGKSAGFAPLRMRPL
jgi:hypothetical protein